MPIAPSYPGVYVEEIPSGVRTIVGVATSITAFVGRALRGPVDEAVTINTFSDFESMFGGLWLGNALGYAVRDFYLNGGSQAIIVRLYHKTLSDENFNIAKQLGEEVVELLKAADTGKAAKEKLAEKLKGIKVDLEKAESAEAKKEDEVQKHKIRSETAAKIAELVNSVPDDAKPESIKKAVSNAATAATPSSKAKFALGDIRFEAAYEGRWGANLRVTIDLDNVTGPAMFNLTVTDVRPGGARERFLNLSVDANNPRRVDNVLKAQSSLLRWDGDWPSKPEPSIQKIVKALEELISTPLDSTKQDAFWSLTQDAVTLAESQYKRAKSAYEKAQNDNAAQKTIDDAKDKATKAEQGLDDARKVMLNSVSDGGYLDINDFFPVESKRDKRGLHALEQIDLFNLLCIPPYKAPDANRDVDVNLIASVAAYCEERRAMLLVDPPKNWTNKHTAKKEFLDLEDKIGTRSRNAALFFPRLRQPNPLRDNQMEDFVPCGAVAGVFARTDTQRGVWKAPAGLDAALVGVPRLDVPLTDAENGELNPLGINCLRAFPIFGRVVWGARTLRGADQFADEYKYVPVRRLALFLEESLYRGTQWVVFEPNDEPLWAQIRLNLGAFMHNLFRQGAFQGSTPREAYFVKCDKETTTQNDINLGIVNIVAGFAPLKPAEFVIIKFQQMAGQIAT